MPDYQKMYTTLFNKITDVIGDLQKVQQICEDIYIDSSPRLGIVEKYPQKNNDDK